MTEEELANKAAQKVLTKDSPRGNKPIRVKVSHAGFHAAVYAPGTGVDGVVSLNPIKHKDVSIYASILPGGVLDGDLTIQSKGKIIGIPKGNVKSYVIEGETPKT